MDHNMFCFQCEQTAGCTGCTSRGVCGKDAQTAQVQDRLTGALIGLARAADTSPDAGPETWQLMIEGLFATLTNVNFDPDSLKPWPGASGPRSSALCRTVPSAPRPAAGRATMIWRSSGAHRRTSAA